MLLISSHQSTDKFVLTKRRHVYGMYSENAQCNKTEQSFLLMWNLIRCQYHIMFLFFKNIIKDYIPVVCLSVCSSVTYGLFSEKKKNRKKIKVDAVLVLIMNLLILIKIKRSATIVIIITTNFYLGCSLFTAGWGTYRLVHRWSRKNDPLPKFWFLEIC